MVGAGAAAAIHHHAIAFDEVALLALLQIAEARHERAAAHQPGGGLAVARFGNRRHHVHAVNLVVQVVAQHAAGVGQPGIQQQARALQGARAPAPPPSPSRAFRGASGDPRNALRSTRPVFLSTLISRTMAFETMSSFPGRERIRQQQIDGAGQAVDAQRGAHHATPRCRAAFASSVNRLMVWLSVPPRPPNPPAFSTKLPSGNCGHPSLRPVTRKMASTRE